jgi:thioredoxin reductase
VPRLRVDGAPLEARDGASLAAALFAAGRACRTSTRGEPRSALCAMGVCFECRVELDGVPGVRACLEPARDGAAVNTVAGVVRDAGAAATVALDVDVAVVGGGPAGIAAAVAAREAGARVVLLDESRGPGGRLWHQPEAERPPAARRWLQRLSASGADVRARTTVYDACTTGDGFRIDAAACHEAGPARLAVAARAVVIATGARELFLPFPGWTLPGVVGVGALQGLIEDGLDVRGKRVVVAGSGPLLLPAAARAARSGAHVVAVFEQAPLAALLGFAAGLVAWPGRALAGLGYRLRFLPTPYRAGTWIAAARGAERVEGVTATDGRRRVELRCDLLACAYGLVPNLELARHLGCAVADGTLAVDARAATSVAGVFAAGEPTGVGGGPKAALEGALAGAAAAAHAAGRAPRAATSSVALAKERRFAARLARAFAPRDELRALAAADTLVCRCEDVTRGALRDCASAREAKLATRAGMGACQGRICGAALEFLEGWAPDTVRPPLKPVPVSVLEADR